MEITENDIKRVETIFFKGKGTFEDTKGERYKFISAIDQSLDVEACPGSGKTTALLAKLYLLSEKMSSGSNGAICVLTHTNVGIDEIKKNLGDRASKLFSYPNFFGTIQSFVDRFLCMPYYNDFNESRIAIIDSDRAHSRLLTSFVKNVRYELLTKVRSYLHANHDIAYKLTIRKIASEPVLVKGVDGGKIEIKKPKKGKGKVADWTDEEKKEIYDALFSLKTTVLKSGVLSYNDAYFYANEYLINYPHVEEAFSSRFSHVFIDEMQDTSSYQHFIIKKLFTNSIVQKIGDSNQAILTNNEDISDWSYSERMEITGSRRFSQPIAKILRTVALNSQPELDGVQDVEIPPYIITYVPGKESMVLDKFCQLVYANGLGNQEDYKYPVKAVGWVGKEKDGLTINSYFHSFGKESRGRSRLMSLSAAVSECDFSDPGNVQDTIINCCLEIIRRCDKPIATAGGKRVQSKTSFINFLNLRHPGFLKLLMANIATWSAEGAVGKDPIVKVRAFLKDTFIPTVEITASKFATTFIDTEVADNEKENHSNIYYSDNPAYKHIPIEIATVHAVKGETHRATLYLETYFHKSCGSYLMDQLAGVPYKSKGKGQSRKEMCLKVAHVGMSRPTHLLCIAINKAMVDENHKRLEDHGWKIV
ncbi:UvrD-helicase domain-containing protein [Flavobacterium psychrotrophum]|uniref:UvrD-helicase domain-containing protein n=1 Tax=Flavobacterium psychrotrophum TaxID=2294119 RepID=UPI000E324284|nr:UvrD-helicase domain-containing protein [Flavobacterium psychrotrophum]